MDTDKLQEVVESLRSRMTPDFAEAQVRELLRQDEDVGGGVNAFRLIKHWLGALAENDVAVRWAYEQLKPALGAALEQVPSLTYFEGD
ncbi:MAG: hypothetical protein JXM73_14795 [Anaerolineae bacterium]|nr:hypothetical protein [Anaerolineae bacterium]